MLEELRKAVYEANLELPRRGLVTYTWGNVSGIDRGKGLMVIKPSGVEYSALRPEDLVVLDMNGNSVEGALHPSSDAKTHLELYRAFPEIDLDAWVRVLGEMAGAAGAKLEKPRLYDLFYQKALEGEADCGGLVSYNYYSGEPVTGVESGRPLFMRRPDARFTLANFARVQLYAAMATLKLGMDILLVEEGVRLDTLLGHGGLFKTPVAGQKLLAGALGVPVAAMETAGEGGPWGMALLAAYRVRRAEGQTLEEYLADTVFRGAQGSVQQPDAADTAGFARFLTDYKSGLAVEKAAAAALR